MWSSSTKQEPCVLRSSFTTFAKKELAGEEPFPTQEESLETVRTFFAEAGREMR